MDDLEVEFSDNKYLKEGSSFINSLARYYSDFLATDFKKGRLPKRRFQTMDSKGRRAGIRLEKFPSFSKIINKLFSKEFKNNSTIKIKEGSHLTQLPAVVHAAIEAEIKNIDVVNKVCSLLDELNPREDGKPYSEQISFVQDRLGHDYRYGLNISKINKDVGWSPKENFDSGLKKTVEWYLDILHKSK